MSSSKPLSEAEELLRKPPSRTNGPKVREPLDGRASASFSVSSRVQAADPRPDDVPSEPQELKVY